MPNPFVDVDGLDAAAKLTGFALSLPETPEKVAVMDDSMIEATLNNGACVRKAAGAEDISGDFTAYAVTESADGVTIKGEGDSFKLATWTAGGYSTPLAPTA